MLMTIALVLAAADGGVPVLFVEAAAVDTGDAGWPPSTVTMFDPTEVRALDGFGLVPDAGWIGLGPSCVIPAAACLVKGKHVADLEAQNVELKRAPPGLRPIVIAAWVGFALGIVQAVLAIGTVCWAVTGSVICR